MSPEFGKRRLLNQMFNKAKTKSLLTNVASKAIVNKIFGFMTGNFVIVIASTQTQYKQMNTQWKGVN